MICANSLRTAGAGFKTDTNVLTLITRDGNESLPLLSKEDAANRIFTSILNMMNHEPAGPAGDCAADAVEPEEDFEDNSRD
jgi:hypothetical protein